MPDAPPAASDKLAFWIHQTVEYAVGVLLAYQAIHSPKPVIPLLAGLLVIVLAATADGPVAAWPIVPRPLHRVLDIVVAVGLLVAAALLGHQVGGAGQIMLVVGGLAMGTLILRSDYRRRPSRAQRKAAAAAADEAATPTAPAPTPSGDKAEVVGRSAGRLVGKGVQAYRRRGNAR